MKYEVQSTEIGYSDSGLARTVSAFEAWLTIERASYALILIAALTLRLIGLDRQPLTSVEAEQALAALSAARALPFDMAGSSPLLFNLQRVVFTLFGADELTARLWPALLGGLSVLFFYAFRYRLGKGGALMAAFLWAISPLAVYISRLGLGAGLTPTFALATVAALEMLLQTPRRIHYGMADARLWAVATGAGVALLVASGPGAYTVIVGALLAALIWRDATRHVWAALRPYLGPAALAFGLTLLLASTFALSAPQGLAAALTLPGEWLRSPASWVGEYGSLELLSRLLISEVLIVGLGIAGIVRGAHHRHDFAIASALFAGVALVAVMLSRSRQPADLALVILPLTFLAGPVAALVIGNFVKASDEIDAWILVTSNLVLLLATAFCLPGAFNPATTQTWRQVFLVVGVVTLALAILEWFLYGAVWSNWQTVGRVLPFVVFLLGVFWTFSQTFGVNHDLGAWRRPGVTHELTGAGYADLERAIRDLAALHGSGKDEAPVDLVLVPGRDEPLAPILLWLLRDFPMVRRSAAVPPAPSPIMIAAAEEQPSLEDRYAGAEFGVLERWQPAFLPDAYARLRWVLFRQTSIPPETRNVVLWVQPMPHSLSGQGSSGTFEDVDVAPVLIPDAPGYGFAP